MSTYRLQNVQSLASVALVGGSPRRRVRRPGGSAQHREARVKGEFALVNPRYGDIDGVAPVRSSVNCR